ncbi:hypothetical protein MBLNU230_g1232t1 [Neophaeotheca triangularis]
MPRPTAPPTPASSTDIRGKQGPPQFPALALPPPAKTTRAPSETSSTPSHNGNASDSSYHPLSPPSPANPRKRSAVVPEDEDEDFALPPPPTRSRKIIHVKPKTPAEGSLTVVEGEGAKSTTTTTTTTTSSAATATGQTKATAGHAGRKKRGHGSGSSTTAAGRKTARKTAHSLIERRRRSKMNDEFAVLKDMIPACEGVEMHKLAILQASIEYLCYLERCVKELKAQQGGSGAGPRAAVCVDGGQGDEGEEHSAGCQHRHSRRVLDDGDGKEDENDYDDQNRDEDEIMSEAPLSPRTQPANSYSNTNNTANPIRPHTDATSSPHRAPNTNTTPNNTTPNNTTPNNTTPNSNFDSNSNPASKPTSLPSLPSLPSLTLPSISQLTATIPPAPARAPQQQSPIPNATTSNPATHHFSALCGTASSTPSFPGCSPFLCSHKVSPAGGAGPGVLFSLGRDANAAGSGTRSWWGPGSPALGPMDLRGRGGVESRSERGWCCSGELGGEGDQAPDREQYQDQEATEALLMLNFERREFGRDGGVGRLGSGESAAGNAGGGGRGSLGTGGGGLGGGGGRGCVAALSVRDLLSR